jgi:hypothetical protein
MKSHIIKIIILLFCSSSLLQAQCFNFYIQIPKNGNHTDNSPYLEGNFTYYKRNISINGSSFICPQTSVTYTVGNAPSAGYTWSYQNSGSEFLISILYITDITCFT